MNGHTIGLSPRNYSTFFCHLKLNVQVDCAVTNTAESKDHDIPADTKNNGLKLLLLAAIVFSQMIPCFLVTQQHSKNIYMKCSQFFGVSQ